MSERPESTHRREAGWFRWFAVIVGTPLAMFGLGALAIDAMFPLHLVEGNEALVYGALCSGALLLAVALTIGPTHGTEGTAGPVSDFAGLLAIATGGWWVVGAGVCVVAFADSEHEFGTAISIAAVVAILGLALLFTGRLLRGRW